ncbi:hypothetical protein [uncultured Tateyamaria sp.]|uniref:hypothetical protein n=1 Tax=uncultured Tateyamaria sp. TaxID=455651 RepID=UPI002626BD51|nr:hypothetical protein [uncultured Tateyamaria sp.]
MNIQEITVADARKFSADQFDQFLAARERQMLLERTVEQQEIEALELHSRILCGEI